MNYHTLTTVSAIAGLVICAYSQPTLQENWWHGTDLLIPSIRTAVIDSSTQTLYVGGYFQGGNVATSFVPPVNTAYGVVVDAGGEGWPGLEHDSPNGTVLAAIPDGTGGWYIGGSFTSIGGTGRNGLAHLNANGSLDVSWDPGGVLGGDVHALVLEDGILYVGGSFTSAGGAIRSRLAAFDAATAMVTSWSSGLGCDNTVNALAVGGDNIYVGGNFTDAGGEERQRIAELDLTTGSATLWNVTISSGAVNTIAYSNGLIFIGGTFSYVNNTYRNKIAVIDATTGLLTSWNPGVGGDVNVIKVSGDTVFVGGTFTYIGGVQRNYVAALALNANTDNVLPWDASLEGDLSTDGTVTSLIVRPDVVYMGGYFFRAGANGAYRQGVACVDRWTAEANAWDASARLYDAGPVMSLADGGPTIYAGGDFSSMGHRYRNGLAAFDMSTGKPTPWRGGGYTMDLFPDTRNLAQKGDTLFVAGGFTEVDGVPRTYIAAVSKSTGDLINWQLDIDAPVNTMAIVGDRLFLGGEFTVVNGISRTHLAAVNINTASVVLQWQADVAGTDAVVSTLKVHDAILYVGGVFSSVGVQPRTHIAALDALSGQLSPFAPQITSTGISDFAAVRKIETSVTGDTVFIGGQFDSVNGVPYENLAALDAITAIPVSGWSCSTPYSYGPFGTGALLQRGPALYASTSQLMGSQPAVGFGVTSANSGIPYAWNPAVLGGGGESSVFTLIRTGDLLIAGGNFTTVGGMDRRSLAVWSGMSDLESNLTSTIQPMSKSDSEVTISPNPTSGQFSIRADHNASMALFDAFGRKVVDMEIKRSVPCVIDLSDHADGLYSIRILQDGHVTTHKVILQH